MSSVAASDWLASSLVALQRAGEAPAQTSGPAEFPAPAPAVARALLDFNALPSRWAHPGRLEAALSATSGLWNLLCQAMQRLGEANPWARNEAILHRHVSASLLQDEALALGWVDGLDDPALPLSLASPSLFESALWSAGLVVLGPAIRQVIVRSELARLEGELGGASMAFVRRGALRLWTGEAEAPRILAEDSASQVRRWGAALMARAFAAVDGPSSRRGLLRLPPDADSTTTLPVSLAEPPQALAMCLAIVHELDASWLSHFPALR